MYKIINDPIYGFVSIDSELILELVNHPIFLRLTRIKQMGCSSVVYPGAQHTRFSHALGAMHLMKSAIESLVRKGTEISKEEKEAAMIAILLHDVGHGPFSHALEHILLDVHHEELSLFLMHRLNDEMDGRLQMSIDMFTGDYQRKFFHQMVSSQLDMDRLDYLQRDCFFSGVVEGSVGASRIIRMLDVHNDDIVVLEKGIYSIDRFLNARRMMYWQVYLHRTGLAAELMLQSVIRRAKHLLGKGIDLVCDPNLKFFLTQSITKADFENDSSIVEHYLQLDDYNIWTALKSWQFGDDPVLRLLIDGLLNRKLFNVDMSIEEIDEEKLKSVQEKLLSKGFEKEDLSFLCLKGSVSNAAYTTDRENIKVKMKGGAIIDISDASDLPNIEALTKIVTKYYLCQPKVVS
ncbi:HD domain-containing protein [Flammeovirga agarivorans]|uniref:HD domain-containing protein n=1 Tax=Flammeovirga agarivorans TaxID=2726742 RepID=A0A7X8SQG0_9BACT|nr:HD domain-containing protein [Flammeovirga agarivorans]NLR94526.1 HD domain-containing protein [Flammeovirga agarivorans]